MIKRLSFLVFVLASLSVNADDRWRGPITDVIEDSMCIPALDGEGYLHIDEDVSGLIISVIGADGAENFLYDDATEIEDVAAPGTGAYTAPSANNVRVSPDGSTGGDCTEMQFADAVYADEDWIQIRVTDGQTTIRDYERWVYLDLMTSRQAGNDLFTSINGAPASQTEFDILAGATNNDAYNDQRIKFVGGTEECEVGISDYIGATKTVFLDEVCPFTIAASDDVYIFGGPAGRAVENIDVTTTATNSAVGALPSAADNTDDWETQSQADPTGFHVNQLEVAGTSQTAGDLAALIATAQADLDLLTDATILASGTCDSGSTTTCVDAALTEANDYWKGAAIVFTSTTLAGQTSCVYDFTAVDDTLLFRAVTTAVVAHTYLLVQAATCEGVVAP